MKIHNLVDVCRDNAAQKNPQNTKPDMNLSKAVSVYVLLLHLTKRGERREHERNRQLAEVAS